MQSHQHPVLIQALVGLYLSNLPSKSFLTPILLTMIFSASVIMRIELHTSLPSFPFFFVCVTRKSHILEPSPCHTFPSFLTLMCPLNAFYPEHLLCSQCYLFEHYTWSVSLSLCIFCFFYNLHLPPHYLLTQPLSTFYLYSLSTLFCPEGMSSHFISILSPFHVGVSICLLYTGFCVGGI